MIADRLRRVDFHAHYDPENPVESGKSVIDAASESGVVAVALLARDKSGSWFSELIKYGVARGVNIIPGIETNVFVDGGETDLICLGFDYNNPEIRKCFGATEKNMEIARLQTQFFKGLGFVFDKLSDVDQQLMDQLLNGEISEKAINFCRIIARTEGNKEVVIRMASENSDLWQKVINKYLDSQNYIGRGDELVAKFLYEHLMAFGKEGFNYTKSGISFEPLSAVEVVRIIHQVGGVVLYSPEGGYNQKIWNRLIEMGIDGIMGWHGNKLGVEQRNSLQSIIADTPIDVIIEARKGGLLILGGSDAQGGDWVLGKGNGQMCISPRRYEEFQRYLQLLNMKNNSS